MRLVEGANLKSVLAENGSLDPARAASIVAQVAAALDAAHADGLVHRDVKPENILLTPSDFAYLADFGIAHIGGESGLTKTGAAVGSCTYMPPERFTSGRVGPQSDVYSLACVFYECLTGQPPFPAGEPSQLMSAHMLAPPPRPSARRPGLARAFDDIIARGMAKVPAARFASAGEFAEMATAAGALPQVAPAAAPRRPQPPTTRQFPAQWPNPAGTGYNPYVDPEPGPEMPAYQHRGGRPWPWILGGAAVGLLLAASLWLMLGTNRTTATLAPEAAPPTTSKSLATTSRPSTTSSQPISQPATSEPTTSRSQTSLDGADAQGFLNYPAARCDARSSAAAMARTTKSVLVVCQAGTGNFYYRGLRLSDGASIELTNVARAPGGWDVTNTSDGTRYLIRPDQLTITNGRVSEVEPIVQYASH
jgi:serine/threonine-protein kinase